MTFPVSDSPDDPSRRAVEKELILLRKKLARTQQALTLLEKAKDRYDSLYYHAITHLSETLELNERMVSVAPHGVIVFLASSGQCILANGASAQILGASGIPEVLAENFRLTPSWGQSGILKAAERALALGKEYRLETDLWTSFGRRVRVDCVMAPFTSRSEKHLLLMMNDTTERHQAEASLRASELQYRTLAENLSEGLVLMDSDFRISYCNPKMLDLLGYALGELNGRSLLDLMEHREAFHSGRKTPTEVILLGKDGSLVETLMSWGPLAEGKEPLEGSLVLFTDIRERKRLDEALRQSQKMECLAHMAGGIAHDFNNVFQCILADLELLRSGRLDETRREASFTRVAESLGKAQALSGEMLDYSGKGFRQSQSLDLGGLVSEQLSYLASLAGREVVLDPTDGELPIHGDRDHLLKALGHLVVNAAEAMASSKDPVRISLARLEQAPAAGTGFWASPAPEGPCISLVVSDRGEGIPADRIRSVCDPFHTTRERGRGLGLSVTLGILRGHGAGFLMGSRPGLGSHFQAVFPILGTDVDPARQDPPPAEVPGSNTIMVVDDEPLVRTTCAEILQEFMGYRVLQASSGLEAIEVYRQHGDAIRIILMDASMPGLNGGEAFDAIKRLRPDAKAILCSGHSEALSRDTFKNHGFATFLKKPFTIKELKQALDFALGVTSSPPGQNGLGGA